jgi:hypothetical protein
MINLDRQRRIGSITIVKKCLSNALVQCLKLLWEDQNLNFIPQAGYNAARGLIQFLHANAEAVP